MKTFKYRFTKATWLGFFLFMMVVHFGLLKLSKNFYDSNSDIFSGFKGNMIAGILNSAMFLLLALFLNANTDENIEKINEYTKKSEAILKSREEQAAEQEEIAGFENFLRRESYHNIRIVDVDLEYEIVPCKDKDNMPIKNESEDETMYLVKLTGPAFKSQLTEAEWKQYDEADIPCDEFYYCKFFNGSWHLQRDSVSRQPHHPFYLSSKVGQAHIGISANDFMKAADDFKGMTEICKLYLKADGTELVGVGPVHYEIGVYEKAGLFIQINSSPKKQIYMTNTQEKLSKFSFVVRNMTGYANSEIMKRIQIEIQKKIEVAGVTIPKVEWYETGEA